MRSVSYDRPVYCLLVYVVSVVPTGPAASSSITPWTVYAHVHLRIVLSYRSTVPLRGDGLGIAIRRTMRLPTATRREIAQFRGRRAVRPLQPAVLQAKGASLLLRGTRGDHLRTEHRGPAIKWCKSCPARQARDQLRSASPKETLCLSFLFFSGELISRILRRICEQRANHDHSCLAAI